MRTAIALLLLGLLGLPRATFALDCPPLRAAESTATVPYTESLLWEVQRRGEPRNVIFGTIHLDAAAVNQPSAAVAAALGASERFGMEVLLDDETISEIAERMRLRDTERLSELLGARWFERASALLLHHGVSPIEADRLRPWAVYMTLSLPPGMSGLPLDLELQKRAELAKLETFGLETIAEQIAVFETLKPAEMLTLLKEAVCHYPLFQQATRELIAHYTAGDLAAVYRLAERYESPAQKRLMARLLDARNQRMAARLATHLARGNAFVAIGALHLPGAEGVLAKLAAAGYQLRALPIR